MGESLQREPDWRPRHAEPRDHRELRNALAVPEFAEQQHFTHADKGASDLRGDVSVPARLIPRRERTGFST